MLIPAPGILGRVRYLVPALFVLVPAAELAVILVVENRIGWPASIAVIVGTGLLGAFLVRRQGASAYAAVRTTLESGVVPGKEMAHAALVLVGGAFLLTPGFLTDAAGFSLMVPAVREVVRLRAASLARQGARW